MRLALAVAVALTGACYDPSVDPGAKFDAGAIDVSADACVEASCDGAMYTDCTGTTVSCPLGCDSAQPHCFEIDPSNDVEWTLVPASAGSWTLATGVYRLDTTTGVATFNGVPLTLPTDIANVIVGNYRVIAAGNITLDTGARLFVNGSLPLILLARGDVFVRGDIDLSGGCFPNTNEPTCAGPGGGVGATYAVPAGGCGPGENGLANSFPPSSEMGGGGGGHGTAGAASTTVPGGTGGAAGIACGTPRLVPLIGGSGGGAGGFDAQNMELVGGRGGGGGGALQITAGGTISIEGSIDAGGAGGESGGVSGAPDDGGGGGGGAGGGILLEAVTVNVTGRVTANGGGGGGNAGSPGAGNGRSGPTSTQCASGGAGGPSMPGGAGGCVLMPPATGGNGATQDRGGGGGAVGRIAVNAMAVNLPGVQSPTIVQGMLPLR